MASLVEQVRDAVTPDVVQKISAVTGERPASTQEAIRTAVPCVLAGVVDSASTPASAERMHAMITEGGYGGLLDNLGNVLRGGAVTDAVVRAGNRLLPTLLGGRTDAVTDLVAGASGIRRNSASTMLGLVTPIVMSVLGRRISGQNLDGSGFFDLLAEQRGSIIDAAPAGLVSLFGARDVEPLAARATTTSHVRGEGPHDVPQDAGVPERTETPERARGPAAAGPWWPAALLAGLAALGLIVYFTRPHGPEMMARTENPAASVGPTATMRLPGGKQVTVEQGGPVYQLGTFLADTSGTSGALPRRIVLDDLNFESGSARLTPASQQTADALVTVLQAYPSARIALEGHTDSTGGAAANKALSEQRAEAVKQILERGGVGGDRVTVVGYGQERPIAPNDTEAGRARNRRLELVVLTR